MIQAALALLCALASQETTVEISVPTLFPLNGKVAVLRGGAESSELVVEASPVHPSDLIGSADGKPARIRVGADLFLSLNGIRPGPRNGLAVETRGGKIVLKLHHGDLLVESLETEVEVETAHGNVSGKASFFLVEVTDESTRIVAIDGGLAVSTDLGRIPLGPGETGVLGKNLPPRKEPDTGDAGVPPWAVDAEAPLNLIRNPGFEDGGAAWKVLQHDGKEIFSIEKGAGRGGSRGIVFALSNVSSFKLQRNVPDIDQVNCLLYQMTNRGSVPAPRYLLRFWLKTEGYTVDGVAAPLAISLGNEPLVCPPAEGKWTVARFLVKGDPSLLLKILSYAPPYVDRIHQGRLWLDDFWLTPLPSATIPGLVAYWKFDGEGNASILNDASGFGHHGLPASLPLAEGIAGKALDFGATSAYMEAPDSDALTPGTELTLSAWIKVAAIDEDYDSIVNKWNQQMEDEYYFGLLQSRRLAFGWHTQGPGPWKSISFSHAISAEAISLRRWTHVAVVRNGRSLAFYIDGKPAGSGAPIDDLPFRNGVNSVRIGGQHRFDQVRHLDGLVDEVRIYARALSAEEIEKLAAPPPK